MSCSVVVSVLILVNLLVCLEWYWCFCIGISGFIGMSVVVRVVPLECLYWYEDMCLYWFTWHVCTGMSGSLGMSI